MNIARRGFLAGFSALAVVPAIVKAENLMQISPPLFWGDGLHDDTAALQAMLDRAGHNGQSSFRMPPGRIYTEGMLSVPPSVRVLEGNRYGPGPRTTFLSRGRTALRFSDANHATGREFVVFETTPLSEQMLRKDAKDRALRGVSWASLNS